MLCAVIASTLVASSLDSIRSPNCPPGSFVDPYEERCVTIEDARPQFRVSAMGGTGAEWLPPSLAELRSASHGAPARASDGLPVPGGIGSGLIYNVGTLTSHRNAALVTKMIVHPGGAGRLTNYLFTTATNRTQKGVEVVGIYYLSYEGEIGVFDWSCMPGHPCEDGSEQPSWIWAYPLRFVACNYSPQPDDGGHSHDTMLYVNATVHATVHGAEGDWINFVLFRNYCRDAWDLVYRHDFAGAQPDCSADNSCGWWGPILETFMPNPQAPIAELGFFGGVLIHDGVPSRLGETETSWVPPRAPWLEFHRNPNSSWGAGNSTSGAEAP